MTPLPPPQHLRALTIDLDDTLWPIGPTIARAERALHDWLAAHAPATAARFDAEALRRVRAEVSRDRPDLAHDLSALRLEAIGRVLHEAGDDPSLAQPAFEVFFAQRQAVQLFDEVPAALSRLAARWPLLALTNGNADIVRTGLAGWFQGSLSARELGWAKPDPRAFDAACERLGVAANEVLHVGDDLAMDVQGALGAGMAAAWIHREQAVPASPPCWHGRDLGALADALGA
jgi:HAD superfamily hydrolase (TIGR01549 family)